MRIKEINKFALLGAIGFLFPLFYCAQSFTASLNRKTVPVGEAFQVSFTINTNASNFVPPSFKDFDVYSGPNQSSNMSFVNGVMSQSISLSYLLVAKKEGKFTIGPASIVANGKKLESGSVTIEVVKGGSNTNQNQSGNTQSQSSGNEKYDYATGTGSDDIFVRTFVSKQKCFLGEQLVVTQKVYSRLNIRGFQNYKLPAYTGFWSKEEDRNKQINLVTENVDGISYYVAEFNKTYLFPQRSGTLEIEPVEIEAICSVQSKKRPKTFFEQFFSSGYEDVLYKLKSKTVKITVNPLPEAAKPENFNGAVGSFNFRAELDRDNVKENEAINLKVVITGKGNINLIDNPKIEFPAEFESYDPKVNENISTGAGVSGTKTYEYLLIPRKRGEYTIKNFNFSYFDPDKKDYVTIPSPELKITVQPGAPGSTTGAQVYTPSNEIQKAENDIRFIKKGNLELKSKEKEFFGSALHYGILIACSLLFIGVVIARGRMIKASSDVVALKERKAAKLARKKLNVAEKFKNENNKEKFYDEIFVALNKYVSDKLNIPVADLNRENIQANLMKRNIQETTTKKLFETLDACEYAKYAPGSVSDNLTETFNNTVELIAEMEEQGRAQKV